MPILAESEGKEMEELNLNDGYKVVRSWLSMSLLTYILEFKRAPEVTNEMILGWENDQLKYLDAMLTKAGFGIFHREKVPEAFLK